MSSQTWFNRFYEKLLKSLILRNGEMAEWLKAAVC